MNLFPLLSHKKASGGLNQAPDDQSKAPRTFSVYLHKSM